MDEVALITGEGGWVIKKRVAHADDVLAHDNAATPRINDHSNVGINDHSNVGIDVSSRPWGVAAVFPPSLHSGNGSCDSQ